jgi:hypothetical protein
MIFCAILHQFHREFRKVQKHDAAAIQQGSDSQRVGVMWRYVLQTHRKMDEFLDISFKQHPSITPACTAHLDRFRVSHTSFDVLDTSVKRLKTDFTTLQLALNHLNGARGNNRTPYAAAWE